MEHNSFTFNGISSLDMGLYVEKIPTRRVAEKDLETYRVPGRSEPLHIWQGSWAPYPVKYRCWFQGNPPEKQLHKIAEWLHSAPVKARLEDTYNTRVFHWATYKGGAEVSILMREVGKFEVEFEVGAQAFLKESDIAWTFTNSGGIVNNQSTFTSKPLVKIIGDVGGLLQIGESSILLRWPGTDMHEYWLDCEEMEAWEIVDGQRVASNAIVDAYNYLQIAPGPNKIEFPGTWESVTVWTRAFTV